MAEPRAAETAVGSATQATGDAAATDEARAPSAASDMRSPERPVPPNPAPASSPPDELLCTICGLTACWKKPDESKGKEQP